MDGNSAIVERATYSQNWPVYNKSQQTEKTRLMELLCDLVQEIDEPKQAMGRPRIALRDLIFASALKVYTQFSLRRFMSDLAFAKEKGFVGSAPCFASVGHFMEREDMTPILKKLIGISSMPLKEIETKFAIDSSGFRTSKFNEYLRARHGLKREHKWVKAHICCGVKTNVITAVEITDGFGADVTQFIPLSQQTNENGFEIKEMTGDKAYSSRANLGCIEELGGTAYIPFKSNARPRAGTVRLWKKMYHYFMLNREEFMQHYHLRSNVESAFSMIKTKFSEMLKSKSKAAQTNELLLKILCHNLCILVEEAVRVGFMPNFSPTLLPV